MKQYEDDTAFMNQLDAARRMRPVMASNLFLFFVLSLFIFFFCWAKYSKVEELTRGEGQVVPMSETQIIQSLEGGILQELLVTEGQKVDKDQVLMRISDVAFASEERGAEAQFRSLQIQKARLMAEANNEDFTVSDSLKTNAPDLVKTESELFASRQKQKANEIAILDDQMSRIQANRSEIFAELERIKNSRTLLQDELAITKRLVAQKAAPKLDEIRLQREVSDLSGQLNVNQKKLSALNAELSGVKKQKTEVDDAFKSQALGELNQVQARLQQLKESLTSIEDRVSRRAVKSPVDGIVNDISVKTIGGVIEPAQKIIEIVPLDDELKIIAKVLPQDIAFLNVGQPVNVKITAYDPGLFGSLKGRLHRIGVNSVKDKDGNIFFEVEVRTTKTYLGTDDNPLPITTGMVANIEIVTGKRTILEYLLKPVLRAKSVALTER